MNTSEIPSLLPDLAFKEENLANGGTRHYAESDGLIVEIIPEKSVTLIPAQITRDVLRVIDYYVRDVKRSVDLLQIGSEHVLGNPNTPFQEEIGQNLAFRFGRVAPKDASMIYLSVLEQ